MHRDRHHTGKEIRRECRWAGGMLDSARSDGGELLWKLQHREGLTGQFPSTGAARRATRAHHHLINRENAKLLQINRFSRAELCITYFKHSSVHTYATLFTDTARGAGNNPLK